MKSFFILLVMLTSLSISAMATDYYSTGSGAASELRKWNTQRDGNGTAPSTFNNANDRFIIQPGHQLTGNLQCAGSVSIEHDGKLSITGPQPAVIASVITINKGGTFSVGKGTVIRSGFLIIQGELQNFGGQLDLNPSYAMVQ